MNVTAPSRVAGTYNVAFGYISELGDVLVNLGGIKTITYTAAAPLTVTSNGAESYRSIQVSPGSSFSGIISTIQYLYVTVAGGVPPYTCVLERWPDPVNDGGTIQGMPAAEADAALDIVYTNPAAPYTKAARGSRLLPFDLWEGDSAQYRYRWKVTDSVGNSVYDTVAISIWWSIWSVDVGPTKCIDPATPILMAGGLIKLAGEVKVGDKVLTYPENRDMSQLREYPVVGAAVGFEGMITVVFTDGRKVKCSRGHFFATRDGWIQSTKLMPGDIVLGTEPGTVQEILENGEGKVIKITVDGAHTFISNGLLSHNQSKDPALRDPLPII